MADQEQIPNYTPEAYTAHMEERKALTDAARESSKTFDQAVLAFGSAVFGFSVAFLKDVAPHPQLYTLKWLAIAWFLFSCGLLAVLLSFLFSHKACMAEIDIGEFILKHPRHKVPPNKWSNRTVWCNYLCVGLFFIGLVSWSVFAFENLGKQDSQMSNTQQPNPSNGENRGYIPPRTPPPPPTQPPPQPPPAKQ